MFESGRYALFVSVVGPQPSPRIILSYKYMYVKILYSLYFSLLTGFILSLIANINTKIAYFI